MWEMTAKFTCNCEAEVMKDDSQIVSPMIDHPCVHRKHFKGAVLVDLTLGFVPDDEDIHTYWVEPEHALDGLKAIHRFWPEHDIFAYWFEDHPTNADALGPSYKMIWNQRAC